MNTKTKTTIALPAASRQPHASSHELGWDMLALPGPRPNELGLDPCSPGSADARRLIALEAMSALEPWGIGLEIQGPWAIRPKQIWSSLGYGGELASLDGRYTRWLDDQMALRSQTSALIPQALAELSSNGWTGGALALPGRVWRRDLRDRTHLGDPCQMDVWILRPGWVAGRSDLLELVAALMQACAPSAAWKAKEAYHPYTQGGLEVEADWEGLDLEVLECGLASPEVLSACGLHGWGGLALGMGLDRLCMLRKGISDIRSLVDPDPRAQSQMRDLSAWRPWSKQPGAVRDISVAVDSSMVAEQVVDLAARAISRQDWLEAIEVVGRWESDQLPVQALARLGMSAGQSNWLLRIKLRDWAAAVPKREADAEARRAWDALHAGSSLEYRPSAQGA